MQCGAKTRAGTPCQQPAGWGTEHPGEGRCKLHGGASLRGQAHPRFKHGVGAMYVYQVVRSQPGEGIVRVNDARVLFDEDGVCRGIVKIGNGPVLNPRQPLRRQDLEAFRQLPGYEVTLEPGIGMIARAAREFMRSAREKEAALRAMREARGLVPRRR